MSTGRANAIYLRKSILQGISEVLSIELKADEDELQNAEIEIYCDTQGLQLLIMQLLRLQQSKEKSDHVHFMTKAWGGTELDETIQGQGNNIVNHLVVMKKL